MKLDESGPVERKDVERAAKRWAHRSYRNASSVVRSKPTRSFDKLHATGSDSQADCRNQIAPRLHISERSILSAGTWRWNGDSRRLPSQPLDTAWESFSSTSGLGNSAISASLTCADVDLKEATLTIRLTKFYKTRRIALNGQLLRVLAGYDENRRRAGQRRDGSDPFFTCKNGDPVQRCVLEDAFLRLRNHVGITRQNARYQPRLHDLRHTFAGHRLTAWYQTGADVQRLLPGLCTHLGHISLSGTQRYLTMTPELLAEAALRFANYAGEVIPWISMNTSVHGYGASCSHILSRSATSRRTRNAATETRLPCCYRLSQRTYESPWTSCR